MTRRGFALLSVLWLLTTLSLVGAVSLTIARVGAEISSNRVLLLRAGWAREACAEILVGRYAASGALVEIDSLELGRGTWCRVSVEDAAGKLDLNRAPRELLHAILNSDSLTDALLDWRDGDDAVRQNGAEAEWYRSKGRRAPRNGPLLDLGELEFVRGFDRAMVDSLRPLITVRGAEVIDVNAASASVLSALPGFGQEAVSQVVRRRETEQRIRSADELLSLLPPSARQALLLRYQEFNLYAGYQPSRVTVRVEGRIARSPLVSAARVTMVPLPRRLAVIRRETE